MSESNLPADLQLIETLRWTKSGGFYLLDLHLDRLKKSADRLGFICNINKAKELLKIAISSQSYNGLRVRLLLSVDGTIDVTTAKFALPTEAVTLQCTWANSRVNSNDGLLQHKTTRRQLFDEAFKAAQAQGYDEILFTNEKGEVTEASRHSLFARFGDRWVTPPLSSGLLDGVMRRHLLACRPNLVEKPLTPAQLAEADELELGNALRGVRKAVIPPV